MHGFVRCALYIASTGAAGFLLGRILPKRLLYYDAPPFRELPFERHGNIYRRIGIHRWHKLLPDMSRILPGTMPPKRISAHIAASQAEEMVLETCVAELVHSLLCVTGLALPLIWPGFGGWIFALLYLLLGNLPFILIQRFNRPKLRMLLDRCRRAEEARATGK